MKQIFLTSSVGDVAHDIATKTDIQKLLFITTAAQPDYEDGQMPDWVMHDRDGLINAGFKIEDYDIHDKDLDEIKKKLEGVEGICFEGGHTFYLLQELKKTGLIDLLPKKVEKGFVYIGSSAGSIVASPDIAYAKILDDPKMGPELEDTHGIGLTNVSLFVHWGSEFFESDYRANKIAELYQNLDPIVLLRDNHYLYISDSGSEVIITKENNE